MASEPKPKLRPENKLRSTTGCSSVSSHTTNTAKATTATMASTMIWLDANQSSSLPLSSMSCNAPTHSTSSDSPTVSIGSLRMGVSRFL